MWISQKKLLCRYGHKGSLAYVGRDKAVMDLPTFGPITGYTAGDPPLHWPLLHHCAVQCECAPACTEESLELAQATSACASRESMAGGGEGLMCYQTWFEPFLCTGVMWKGFETYSQISLRNIFLVASDWVRTKLFGRDISKV